jgi:hypothetical protein
MRQVITALFAMTCLACAAPAAHAQAAVGFRNETPLPLIIQGCSVINGMQRRGMPMVVAPGRVTFDINVPLGFPRFYTVHNANQPAHILLRDFQVPVARGDILLIVRPSLQAPGQVELHLPGT